MLNPINQVIIDKYKQGPEDTSWLYDHSAYVVSFALAAGNMNRMIVDDIFRKRIGYAGLMIHSGLSRTDNEYYLSESVEFVDEVFANAEVDSEFVMSVIDILVDYWKGLDGFQVRKKESGLLLAAEFYTRFHTNFFVNAYDTFDFADFRDFRGWAKDHFQAAKKIAFPRGLEVSKQFLGDFRHLFDVSKSIANVSSGLDGIVSKERVLQKVAFEQKRNYGLVFR